MVQDISDLIAQRHRIANHPTDILKREAEVRALQGEVKKIVLELGWDIADEETLASFIPSRIARAEINDLLQSHGRKEETASSAGQSVIEKEGDLENLIDEAAGISGSGAPPYLSAALNDAHRLGDVDERIDEVKSRIPRCPPQT